MSKSELRKEYEARFGAVEGWLELYDAKGNLTYREESTGFWVKYECDDKGNVTYSENSEDYWVKREYDDKSNLIYRESRSRGISLDKRNNLEGKIATIDGKEYKLTEINRRKYG